MMMIYILLNKIYQIHLQAKVKEDLDNLKNLVKYKFPNYRHMMFNDWGIHHLHLLRPTLLKDK